MPTFELTSPWGQKYRVEAPEGATQEQAYDVLKQHLSQTQDNPIGQAAAIQRAREQPGFKGMAARGLTGFAQGVEELAGSGASMLGIKPGLAYETQEKAPIEGTEKAGRIAGNIAPLAVAGPTGAVGRAVVGGVGGALQPADSLGQRLINTGAGALGGGTTNLISKLTPRQLSALGTLAASWAGLEHGGYGGAALGWPVHYMMNSFPWLGQLAKTIAGNPGLAGGTAGHAAPTATKVIENESGGSPPAPSQ